LFFVIHFPEESRKLGELVDSRATESQPLSDASMPRKKPFDPFSPEALFTGGGELGALMAEMDWANTPLGPVRNWPQNLKTCIRIVLTSRQPMFVWWGDELINLYNDAYKTIVGGKHPQALGQPAQVVWKEIWDQVGPRAELAMRANEGTYDEALLLIMERYGYREETYYTFSYSPVPNDQGGTGGIFCANSEDTQRIISERQLAVLGDLAARTGDARTWQEVCRSTALSLATDPKDLCFALIYAVDSNPKQMVLAGATGIEPGHWAAISTIDLEVAAVWPVFEACHSHEISLVRKVDERHRSLPTGAWDRPPHTVAVVPIPISGPTGRPGAVVIGLNPYRVLDDNYLNFLKLIANQISTSLANAEAYEQERRRAESLAELDRAKTTFFSNVSHEFRTPLTLMLAPLEDILAGQRKWDADEQRREIEIVHRNGLRLLKLVNTLLDFSRIEAGRVQAVYQPLDLCAATIELASVFRAAMDAAGLNFEIHCSPLSQTVYIDAEMWEKIVLNLLSNALKFTMTGTVEVRVQQDSNYALFSVHDTGVGIPASELPRVFERFHRIEGTQGRTHEGTGIGLALVDELVRLHGGNVEVASEHGAGTTFMVRIPFGRSHLPANRVVEKAQSPTSTRGALPYVQEALQWLPDFRPTEASYLGDSANQDLTVLFEDQGPRPIERARVLLVDDNRDIREYIERLLARNYEVTSFEDGELALAAILENAPDLVLTDVMMPRLDGFGLLKELRENPDTASIPVIMLSARAGEEARSEGMEAGADDYLVKPFTARELMARVGSHITMHKMRTQLTAREHEQRLKAEKAQKQYRMILDSISEGFLFLDDDWNIQYINDQAAAIIDRKAAELLQRNLWSEFPGLEATSFGQAYHKARQTGEVHRLEDYYAPLQRWFHANIYPSQEGLSVFVQDVTEKRNQQEKLLVTEKLAATGRLAATIAHEINNPLESVMNLLYLARISRTATPETIQQYLMTAEQELTRVSQIARHTLGFYRETSIPADVDVARVLDDALTVYQSRLNGNHIEVTRNFQPVPHLHALRGEIHQVFSNLISNAIDAMQGGGHLTVSLANSQRCEQTGIEIVVGDDGSGISPDHLQRLFEPFFTTKLSVGTGLGLWVVKQFVEQHAGTVSVDSSTGATNHGTRFIIFLPLAATISVQHHVM
jgi:PAS domain S-box-containing protein